jgi:mannosidase alpha-like ER degradation enhancer 2
MKFSDLFKSDQLSAFLSQFQQQANSIGGSSVENLLQNKKNQQQQQSKHQNHNNNERQRHPNRRMMLYDLSVRSHYERMLQQRGNKTTSADATTSKTTNEDVSEESNNNLRSSRCSYYNQGLDTSFDVREMIRRDENLFSRFSHWTLEYCRGGSLSQIHLEPVPLGDDERSSDNSGGSGGVDDGLMRLPSSSLLANDIQFAVPVINNLGTYVDPTTASTHDFESVVKLAFNGADEIMANEIEYYLDGDSCTYEQLDGQKITTKRQSAVLYDTTCCKRQRRTMDEFFQQHDEIMILGSSEPSPCKYVLRACNICTSEKAEKATTTQQDDMHSLQEPPGFRHLLQSYINLSSHKHDGQAGGHSFPPMPPSQIEANKQLLKKMFTHAWDSYMYNAFPASELKPLTCQPGTFDLVRIPALTLIDTLDTLIIMNNYTEFARSVERLRFVDRRMQREFHESGMNRGNSVRKGEQGGIFSVDQNVSVFETTIRVLGGLLSAHQLAEAFMKKKVPVSDVWDSSGEIRWGAVVEPERNKAKIQADTNVDEQSCSWDTSSSRPEMAQDVDCTTQAESKETESSTWAYDGFLLKLATDIGNRLVYAFDTASGIPYGTVNLLHGIPPKETTVASLAGAGTLTLEFELLSRLTGNLKFGKAAKLATRALWVRRSEELNLFGKHIDVKSGKWVEYLSGVGSNSDSFYEYLVKHHILFPDDADFWTMFVNVYSGIHDNSRLGEWYVDVDMGHGLRGNVRQIFESLMAFYPGMQILLGEVAPSAKTLNSFFLVREFLGLLPERFDFIHWKVDGRGDLHPLRPELLESNYFLHLASIGLHGSKNGPCAKNTSSPHTSSWLWAADFALHTVNKLSWRPCGFATVRNVSPTTTGGLDLVQGNRDPEAEQKRRHISHHNEMPSFFLSETIKYLYLTFDAENNVLHQDSEREWVFTTEAHPIHHEPVSSTPFLSTEDSSLDAQIDKVRSLLRAMISNASAEESGTVEEVEVKNNTKHLTFERWARNTRKSTHTDSMAIVEAGVKTRKREELKKNGLMLGPHFQRNELIADNSSIFSEGVNFAYHQFDSLGKGRGLGKRCPNFHHPDLIWSHALNGNTLDYNTHHHSLFSNEVIEVKGGKDQRVLSALAATCFHGTDYYADRKGVDRNKSCPAEEDPLFQSEAKAQQHELERIIGAPIPGSKRYDMGGDLGLFDVSAFESGDGFAVRHVNSGELLEVSIFYDDLKFPSGEGDDGDADDDDAETLLSATVLTLLTLPTLPEASNPSAQYDKTVTSLSSWVLSGWRQQLTAGENVGNTTYARSNIDAWYKRQVVVADLAGNQFSCEVILTDDRNLNHTFPCAPSFFGKADITELTKNSGASVNGQLLSPPIGDELGCNSLPLNHHNFCSDKSKSEENILQLIRRGDCNFVDKASNQAARRNAAAMIVVNSSPNELFAMAGVETDAVFASDCSIDDLPLSVMVNGIDGESIMNLLESEKIKESRLELNQILEDDEYFPHVTGSEKSLKISAQSGWGTHAVRQNGGDARAWQLFILRNADP